jgi:hypothetical protein
MLRNEAYLGHTLYNRRSRAKHTVVEGGKAKPLRPEDKKARRDRHEARGQKRKPDAAVILANPESDVIRKENTHTPLVSPELFARCGDMLRRRRNYNQTKAARDYTLAGLLKCSCGGPMTGRVTHYRSGSPVFAYCCAWHRLKGPAACPYHRVVPEAVVLESVSDCILLALSGAEGESWEAALRERLRTANHDVPAEAARLRSEVATLEGNLAKARRNLSLLDPDMLAPVQADIRQWEARLSVLKPRLTEVNRTARRVAAIEERVAEARRLMLSVGQAFLYGDNDEKRKADRQAVRGVVERIVCEWDETQVNGRVRSRLKGVRVEFRADSLLGPAIAWPAEEPAEEEVCPSSHTARRLYSPVGR